MFTLIYIKVLIYNKYIISLYTKECMKQNCNNYLSTRSDKWTVGVLCTPRRCKSNPASMKTPVNILILKAF